jgi:TonB family protein
MLLALTAGCHRQAAPSVAPREPEREVKATVMPRLTPHAALAKIETSYLGGLRRCYRARLKRDASTGGRVVVTFTVDEAGRLSSRRARGPGRGWREIEACVERAMSRWSFAPPAEETTFRLAFQLSSRS